MNNMKDLDQIRGHSLQAINRNEMWFRLLIVLCGVCEAAGLVTLVVVMDWSNGTHVVIFVAALLVYLTLALWVWALAARNRIGEQRILRAIELLSETRET